MIPILIALFVVIGNRRGWLGTSSQPAPRPPSTTTTTPSGASEIMAASRDHRSDVWVECSGIVVRVLPDDRDGASHQKMLVRIYDATDLTVLIAHYLDAAKRVPVE